jgi:hypothetical protein
MLQPSRRLLGLGARMATVIFGFFVSFQTYCNIGALLVAGGSGPIKIRMMVPQARGTAGTPAGGAEKVARTGRAPWRVVTVSLSPRSKLAIEIRNAISAPRLYLLLPPIGVVVGSSIHVDLGGGRGIDVFGWRRGKPAQFTSGCWPIALAEFRDANLVRALQSAVERGGALPGRANARQGHP